MIFGIIIGAIPLVIIVISFILDKKIKKNEEDEKKKNEGIYTDKDGNEFVDGMPIDDYLDWVCT